jgi:hypothetical protein
LNLGFFGDEVCLHSMDCCFDSGGTWDTHVSSPVTIWLKNSSSCLLYRVRKVKALSAHLVLCSPESIFGTQCQHNFR